MKTRFAAAVFAVMGFCTPAMASDPESAVARHVGGELIAGLDAMGYDTKTIDRDGSKYRLDLLDRQTGRIVNAVFDATSGELLQARLEEEIADR